MLPVDAVDARCVVEARITEAFVDLGRAELVVITIRTDTCEGANAIDAPPVV